MLSVVVLFVFVSLTRPPDPTLFPYTTLFRSRPRRGVEHGRCPPRARRTASSPDQGRAPTRRTRSSSRDHRYDRRVRGDHRSEEHTSELQSRGHLVCRLLLEKKKVEISTTLS